MIAFLDTEETDKASVLAEFPDAVFLDPALEGPVLAQACAGAEIVSTFVNTRFPREVIDALPQLKLLCTRSVGTDHIDVAACKERGITVCHVPDYGSHVVAEHAFALLLSTLRHIPEAHARVREGRFDYHGLRGTALKNKTLGIIGTGKIGRGVGRIARGFGMRILGFDAYPATDFTGEIGGTYVPLDDLLIQSDVISLHVPATPETRGMFNDALFAKMKRGVVIVNTARGTVIDEPALLRALDTGIVSHALLDVLADERHADAEASLTRHPRVVATPHIAFYADDSMRTMYLDCFQSIREWKAGNRPAHAVA